ncbi:ras guanine nucleotide exchange factor Y-like [Diaphorina citri]|uniref:Ras guanine nucleotide exchange factor Y-like n=1 Tax=Diaphorina citri TaxID=121845 RepID=A0A3Q0J3W9_DIACI|nr:ras guanine nucleotide exchange factor Y-like [Diaphorina citri]
MNSNQYSNYGFNNQPAGKHNLPPIAAISSAVNYRATASRTTRPNDNTTGYTGQAQQGMYNQGGYQAASYPESSNPAYQYNNSSYPTNSATPYPDQQSNNFNTFNQRPADPPSNSQPSYLVPQPIKANAATYSDSRFAMFPEPNSQKHLDNYIKPSQNYNNYTPLPNFKDLTSGYSQQQYTPQGQGQPSKQSPVPKPNDPNKMTGYSGMTQMPPSDWLNKPEYQNNKSKPRTEAATDLYSKKLQSMSVPVSSNAQPSFQPMEVKPQYQNSSGQNYGYGQGDNKTLTPGYRTNTGNNNNTVSPYQMFNSPQGAQGDFSSIRDHDGFKVPQQIQNLPDVNVKSGNPYQNSAHLNTSNSGGQYIPESTKSFQRESSKNVQQQNPPPNKSSKGAKSAARYPYAEHKRTDSLPNIAQYDYKINDRMQPAMTQPRNPSMKQSYSLNNLNMASPSDNRYPGSQLNSNSPLDNRLISYASSESLHSSYMKDLNFADPRYSHPGATSQSPNSKSIDNRSHQSYQNMDYNYRNTGQFPGQGGKATTLDNRLTNVSTKQQDSNLHSSGYPPNDNKTMSSDNQMKTSYPSSSFISDKFNSMAAGNNFQAQNDSSIQQHSSGDQNSYNFQAQQYSGATQQLSDPVDVNSSRSYYPQQQNDMLSNRSLPGRSSVSPHRTKLQSPHHVTASPYSRDLLIPSPHSTGGSPRSSVLTSPLNTLQSSSQYKVPPSPKDPTASQNSNSPSPKGSITNSPHSTVPLSPYNSIPSSPHAQHGQQHYPLNSQHSVFPHHVPMSPHTSIPPSPVHNSVPASPYHSSIPPSPQEVPPSPSPLHNSIPPSPSSHPNSIPPPSPHQTSLPPPSPHQTSIPPSPSSHQTSIPPPSPHLASIPPSPSSHQTSIPPPSPHLASIPPSPSSHQTSIPPSSPHQTSIPPSTPHQTSIPPPSPHQTSIPPSPSSHQTSIPTSSPHQTSIPPSPSLQQPSIPPSPSSHQPSIPPSSSHQTSIPPSPHQTSLTPSDEGSSHSNAQDPTNSLMQSTQPSISPSSQQPPNSLQASIPESPHSLSTPTTPLCTSQSVVDPPTDNIETNSTELQSGKESEPDLPQPSSDEPCPEVQTPVPESQDVTKTSETTSSVSTMNNSLDIPTPMDLEQCVKSPTVEFQTLLSLRRPDSVSPKVDLEQCVKSPTVEFQTLLSLRRPDSVSPKVFPTLNQNSEEKENKERIAQIEPERLKTPELEKPESPKPDLPEGPQNAENVELTATSVPTKDERETPNSNSKSEGDISIKFDVHVKQDDENTCTREENLNRSTSTKPSSDIRSKFDVHVKQDDENTCTREENLNRSTSTKPSNNVEENINSTIGNNEVEKGCDLKSRTPEDNVHSSLLSSVDENKQAVNSKNSITSHSSDVTNGTSNEKKT